MSYRYNVSVSCSAPAAEKIGYCTHDQKSISALRAASAAPRPGLTISIDHMWDVHVHDRSRSRRCRGRAHAAYACPPSLTIRCACMRICICTRTRAHRYACMTTAPHSDDYRVPYGTCDVRVRRVYAQRPPLAVLPVTTACRVRCPGLRTCRSGTQRLAARPSCGSP